MNSKINLNNELIDITNKTTSKYDVNLVAEFMSIVSGREIRLYDADHIDYIINAKVEEVERLKSEIKRLNNE